MTREDEIRRQKLIDTVMNAQSDYYSNHPTRTAQYQPEIGGYVAPGAGAEMADPIIWDEVLKEYKNADEYASEYLKKNK